MWRSRQGNRKGIIDEISYSEVSTVITDEFIYFTGTISNTYRGTIAELQRTLRNKEYES